MKKVVIIISSMIFIALIVTIIVININNKENELKELEETIENVEKEEEKEEEELEEIEELSKTIKLTINQEEVFVELNDTNASKEFMNMLPLTLTFEDYNNVEKISVLESALNTTDSPSGYDPEIGDFSYYIPWGNISIFYKDFRYSNSLVKLGTITSGLEVISNLNGDFEVTIEKI